MVCIALPSLIGIIWAVGITRGALSEEAIVELPKRIVSTLPEIIDEGMRLAESEEGRWNENSRIWLKAMQETGIKPGDVLQQSGITMWVEKDLTAMLREMREFMRGNRHPDEVKLDMRPLKKALNHPVIDEYAESVLAKLPECDTQQAEEWSNEIERIRDRWSDDINLEKLPACRPDIETGRLYLAELRKEWMEDIPDQVDVFEYSDFHGTPFGINIGRASISFSFLLFLIPAVFILLGAAVAASNRTEFYRWIGMTVLIGGLLALGTVFLTTEVFHVGEFPFYWDWHSCHDLSISQFRFIRHLGLNISEWIQPFFTPVREVSEVTAILGLLIFALTFLVTPVRRKPAATPPAPAQTPASESPPAIEEPQPPKESE